MKNEEDIMDLLIEALVQELENMFIESLDNPSQYDTEEGIIKEDGLDFDIKGLKNDE
jgi:hypothetical protein